MITNLLPPGLKHVDRNWWICVDAFAMWMAASTPIRAAFAAASSSDDELELPMDITSSE